MDEQPHERSEEHLLMLLKTLADESRLTLLRLLAEGELTAGELAGKMDLSDPTISHHLSRLREAGFASLRMAGNQRYYRLNTTSLAKFKKMVMEIEKFPPEPEPMVDDSWIAALGWDPADQKVLREHTRNGTLINLPAKQHKMLVVLRWLATMFEPERMYSEVEVNEILKTVYAQDYVSLRRDLIDLGYLRRERGGGKYWVAPDEE
jgi:DNA-binding HxlR family transcriptional regulator